MGGPEEFFAWASSAHRSQIKPRSATTKHRGIMTMLEQYPARTGLPLDEYVSHLSEPTLNGCARFQCSPRRRQRQGPLGGRQGDCAEARKSTWRGAIAKPVVKRNHVVLIPRYGHFGFMEMHNEKFVVPLLWALKTGYFGKRM